MNDTPRAGRSSAAHHEEHGAPLGVATASDSAQPDGPLLKLVKDKRIAFLAVGAFNTAVGLGTFALFHEIFGAHLYVVTLLCSHAVSVVIAFFLYRYLVFRVRGQIVTDFLRFETVYLLSLAINAVLLALAVSVLHFPVMPSMFVITALQAVWSWVGHDRFSFRRPKESA